MRGTLNSWKDLESKFMIKFFPTSKYLKARNEIITFYHEPLYDSWERFHTTNLVT
ncbi:hypothetical protein CR513_43186, partial [Mucuna pruriens]